MTSVGTSPLLDDMGTSPPAMDAHALQRQCQERVDGEFCRVKCGPGADRRRRSFLQSASAPGGTSPPACNRQPIPGAAYRSAKGAQIYSVITSFVASQRSASRADNQEAAHCGGLQKALLFRRFYYRQPRW